MTGYVTNHIIYQISDITIVFFLDTNFDKYIDIWDHNGSRKNLLNLVRNWGKNHIY